MAELVDALASGASELTLVKVQVLSRAPEFIEALRSLFLIDDNLKGYRGCITNQARLQNFLC